MTQWEPYIFPSLIISIFIILVLMVYIFSKYYVLKFAGLFSICRYIKKFFLNMIYKHKKSIGLILICSIITLCITYPLFYVIGNEHLNIYSKLVIKGNAAMFVLAIRSWYKHGGFITEVQAIKLFIPFILLNIIVFPLLLFLDMPYLDLLNTLSTFLIGFSLCSLFTGWSAIFSISKIFRLGKPIQASIKPLKASSGIGTAGVTIGTGLNIYVYGPLASLDQAGYQDQDYTGVQNLVNPNINRRLPYAHTRPNLGQTGALIYESIKFKLSELRRLNLEFYSVPTFNVRRSILYQMRDISSSITAEEKGFLRDGDRLGLEKYNVGLWHIWTNSNNRIINGMNRAGMSFTEMPVYNAVTNTTNPWQ